MYAMRKIASHELRLLICSPFTWLLLIAFSIQSSMEFTNRISTLLRKIPEGANVGPLTYEVFITPLGGIFPDVKDYLFLFIPLVTMGLISRERHSGAILLSLTSPVRVTDIVIGKYLAVMVYAGLLMLSLLILMMTSGLVLEFPDYPALMTAILGLYLLTCAFGAVGLFMSSLTTHQLVAAIGTLAALAILSFIGAVGQTIPVVNKITYWFSLPRHLSEFEMGLITTAQIFYFICVIGMFLAFTVLKLSSGQKTTTWGKEVARYAAISITAITAGYITSLPQFIAYFDMTQTQSNSLSPESIAVIEKIEGDWKVVTYVNLLDRYNTFGLPWMHNYHFAKFERFIRHNHRLEIKYIFYYGPAKNEGLYRANPNKTDRELAQMIAAKMDLNFDEVLSTEEINESIDLAPEKYRFVHRILWGGKSAFLRTFDDLSRFPGEREISAALKRLLVGSSKIAYVTEHSDRQLYSNGPEDYQTRLTDITFRIALVNQGFDVVETKLDTPVSNEIDILFIANPLQTYSEAKTGVINDFIANGGNLIIAAEPGNQGDLNKILTPLGVNLMTDQVYEKQGIYDQSMIFAHHAEDIPEEFIPDSYFQQMPIYLNGAVGIKMSSSSEFTVTPVLNANPDTTWLAGAKTADGEPSIKSDTPAVPLAVALTRQFRGHQQRIFVIGDADFMSNSLQTYNAAYAEHYNGMFVTDIFNWLSDGEYPLKYKRVDNMDKRFLIDTDHVVWMKIVFYGIIPLILFLFAGIFFISRRRR